MNRNRINLSGEWQLKLGGYEKGERLKGETCLLPGTLDENKKGNINNDITINRLNRKYSYTGPAVYERCVDLPENFADKYILLVVERTKLTKVWLNDIPQETCFGTSADTLGTAQIYRLCGIKPGCKNIITIEVTNDNYPVGTGCHMLTEETVTNWNGIIGDFYLEARALVGIESVRLYPDIHKKQVIVKASLYNESPDRQNTVLRMRAVKLVSETDKESADNEQEHHGEISYDLQIDEKSSSLFELSYPMGENISLWSEFSPELYKMSAELYLGNETFLDKAEEKFGMREFSSEGSKFVINGIKTFLRGEGNSAVFPLTGYPYMDKSEWLGYFRKAKEIGINFFRFHSWTPPEQAFEAADELGIYMQPELYAFGGTPFDPENGNEKTAKYYEDEAVRILKALANHPSFVMMAWGNELDTASAEHRFYARKLKQLCKAEDKTRLYAEGSNNNFWAPSFNEDDDYWTTCKTHSAAQKDQIRISFSWVDDDRAGLIETLNPNTAFNFDKALEGYEKPVMSHEAGQYQTLPYFEKEIPKYEAGIFEARNLEHYKEVMAQHGLLHMNEIFSRVSARVSAIGYRADIETALRSKRLAGYQLLSIQDFPGQGTAHVGILDNFMEEKPGEFAKEQYRSFNRACVALAVLPKFIYENSEIVSAKAAVVNYSPKQLQDIDIYWYLKDGEEKLSEGKMKLEKAAQGTVTETETFSCGLKAVKGSKKLVLTVGSRKIGSENNYYLWVYPEISEISVPENVIVSDKWDVNTKEALRRGKRVLLLPSPEAGTLPESTAVRFTTDYWSRMFHRSDRDAHTMGMYIRREHGAFREFATDEYNDYQWFRLMKGSRAVILDGFGEKIQPLVWNIDHMEWGRKLSSLFEAKVGGGKLMVCSFDLMKQKNIYPEAAQLYLSVLKYMASEEFCPEGTAEISEIDRLVVYRENMRQASEHIQAKAYDQASLGVRSKDGGICGPDSGYSVTFNKIDFGEKGYDKISVIGTNTDGKDTWIEIINGDTGCKIADIRFSGHNRQEFNIQRQTGVKTLVFKTVSKDFVFQEFFFEETKYNYMDPYKQLDPESVFTETIIEDGKGGRHKVMQNYVGEIVGPVTFTFCRADFGEKGSCSAVLKGRTTKNEDVSGRIIYEVKEGADTEKVEKSIPFIFKAGQGEAYELSSETFYKQQFEAKGIKGVQNLKIIFDAQTGFEFESITFKEKT